MKKKISIVIPAYNEADGIAEFHEQLTAVTGALQSYTFEIIYVVDKCKDNTLQILKGLSENKTDIIAVGMSRRFGHQMSLVAGLDMCTGDACIMMDSDLEHPPDFIPVLLEKFEEGYDVVHTKRVYAEKVSPLKKWTSKLFYRVLNMLSPEDLGESSADFRLVSRRVVDVFHTKIREHNQYLRGLFHWIGFNQTEVTFQAGVRKHGRSNYTIKRLFDFASEGIISFSKLPLKMAIVVGLVIAALGACYGIYLIFSYFFFTLESPAGWMTLITLLMLIGGLLMFMQGIVGLYIASIFDEVKNRPLYIVESCFRSKNLPEGGNIG